jgi:uncharacterized protein
MPGGPATCDGQVLHRRLSPRIHEFRSRVSYVWLDPDAPGDLCRHHPLWSSSHPAPARFRAGDYGNGSATSLGDQVRDQLSLVTGHRPDGQVRMLTQMRRWGWLFNPITLYVAWNAGADEPVGAVLEVTSTPWKERHRYAVELVAPDRVNDDVTQHTARIRKAMHVSPFLDEQFDYVIGLSTDRDNESLDLTIDVVSPDTDRPILTTRLHLLRQTANRRSLGWSLRHNPISTHRVSLGIHAQAARLWAKRVPFVAHPRKRAARS